VYTIAKTVNCTAIITPDALLREARAAAGLTQAEVARRMGTTQPVVARLERPGANPRYATLERALRATGHRLGTAADASLPDVDETQIRERLRLTPAERLATFRASQRNVVAFARGARRVPR
jgi:transcriptional regulator with XRE-family HTH domain